MSEEGWPAIYTIAGFCYNASMITLYIKPGCPYCMKTVEEAKALGLTVTEKSIYEPGISEELIARGGKRQMPYMVDEEHGVEMYESEDIIHYLHETFG